MNFQFSIGFSFFLIIIFNSLSNIICQNNEEDKEEAFPSLNDSQCLTITLYNNGTLVREKSAKYTQKIITIASVDKIIIYDCLDYNNGECSYRNWTNNKTKEDALETKAYNSDFYSCYIFEEYYKNNTTHFTNAGCISVEKNEYGRFRGNNYDINKFKPFNKTRLGRLECFDIYYIPNKYFHLFIVFLLFLF